MPQAKWRNKRKAASFNTHKKSRSFFSSLKNLLFSCTGKNSVRVQPQHISVQSTVAAKANDVDDGQHSPQLSVFNSSRPQTAANQGRSRPSTCRQTIKRSTTAVANGVLRDQTESISGLDATSGHTISTRPVFVGHSIGIQESNLAGLSPSPATSTTSRITEDSSRVGHVEEKRAPVYIRRTLTQVREMQRQKRIEERMKKEQQHGRKAPKASHNLILVDEVKPKKRLSQRIREEEMAVKEMQQMLIELDHDETEVLKKMQELNNCRVELESVKDNNHNMCKPAQLNEVILILEDRLHRLKNYGEKIESKIGLKEENLAKLKAEYEQIRSSGITEEDIETEELLRQFFPTLGIPVDTALSGDLEDVDEKESITPSPLKCVPPRCKNPVATQLLGGKHSRTKRCHLTQTETPLLEILNEYRHTLKHDLALIKGDGASCKRENDGMKKFMQSLMQSESKK